MAGFDYGRMAATATRLLQRFKQGVVQIVVPGTPTPGVNPWDPPVSGAPSTITLNATVKAVEDKFVDGTTVLATDRMVTAAPFGSEMLPGHGLTIDGKAVTIIKQMRIPAAGVVVAWKWIVRG